MSTPRYDIIADINGILPSLEAVLTAIESDPPDEIIVAGDFVGGPQSRETLALLREMNCRFILGNGEVNMLKMHHGTAPESWWTRRQFDLARWVYRQLNEEDFRFLEELSEQLVIFPEGCKPFRVVHGAPWDVYKLVFPHTEPDVLSRALQMIPEDVLVFAHTHLPDVINREDKLAVNPGSVSNNLDGDVRATYATLTWDGKGWHPELHGVDYDLDLVQRVFEDTGFLEANRPLARGFLESILTGENTAWNFILYAFEQARKAGYDHVEAVPDEIWLAAEATYKWTCEL
jgi:putative phosphoesterase